MNKHGEPTNTNKGGLDGRTAFSDKDVKQGYKRLGDAPLLESPTGERDASSNPNQDTVYPKVNR
jgi:hypothetical protein